MLGNRDKYIRRAEKLPKTSLKAAKMEAGILGTDFMIRTLERPATLRTGHAAESELLCQAKGPGRELRSKIEEVPRYPYILLYWNLGFSA